MLLFFLSAVVMSGLETDRYEYSNFVCESRVDGEEGPHNSLHKLRLCLHFLYSSPPPLPPSPSQLVSGHKWPGRMSQTMPNIDGDRTCKPTCFSFAKCTTNTERHFPFAFIAQASVEMDRYRGLCCWYASITSSLCLCSLLVHASRRPCLPAMTNTVVSAHGMRVGLVTT